MDLCQQISKLKEQIKENIKENEILKDERDKYKNIMMGMTEYQKINQK
jgi:regulator of replication initiation timing